MNTNTRHKLLIARVHGFMETLIMDEAMQGDAPEADYSQPGISGTLRNVRVSDHARTVTPPLVRQAFKRIEGLMSELYPETGDV